MQAQQFSVKVFLEDASQVEQEEFIAVFHGWIRDRRLGDKLLIDVADYRHVHNGPGVMIIGDQGHFAMDEARGHLGMQFSRRRDPLRDAEVGLREALSNVLAACQELEEENGMAGRVSFDGARLEIRILSRLIASNTEETLEAFRPSLDRVLTDLYPAGTRVTRREGQSEPFTILVEAEEAPSVSALVARLN